MRRALSVRADLLRAPLEQDKIDDDDMKERERERDKRRNNRNNLDIRACVSHTAKDAFHV